MSFSFCIIGVAKREDHSIRAEELIAAVQKRNALGIVLLSKGFRAKCQVWPYIELWLLCRALGGIPLLVSLLSHEQPDVQKAACGALRNLSCGRANDTNKVSCISLADWSSNFCFNDTCMKCCLHNSAGS